MRRKAETELVEAARRDLDAFGELVERFRDSIARQCLNRVRDRHYAEDLAQETFIRAYLKLDQLREPEHLGRWLRKIAANVCKEFARSPLRREHAWEALPEVAAVMPREFLQLDTLSEETRECLELRYSCGLSYSEIADLLCLPVHTVRNRMHRAKERLRREMGDMTQRERSPFTDRVLDRLRRLQDQSRAERKKAAREIHRGLAKDRVDWMVSRLRQDDPMERSFDIRKSRRVHSPRVRDALTHILLHDEWEENRIKAANALVAQADPAAIPYLEAAADSPDTPKDVRSAALSAIRQLEKMPAPSETEREERLLRGDLAEAATDRKARVELLRQFRSALHDLDPGVRNQAIKALSELGDKRAAPAVARLLDDPVPGIRQSAAMALGRLKSARSVAHLAHLLESGDRPTVRSAVTALGEVGANSGVPALLQFLGKTEDYTLVVFALLALEKLVRAEDLIEVGQVVQNLKARLPRYREQLDHQCGRILAKAGDRRHVGIMIDALHGCPGNLALIEALGRIGDSRAVDVLKENMAFEGCPEKQSRNYIRLQAALALTGLGEPGWQAVRESLKGSDVRLRTAAAQAMFHGPVDEESVGLLEDMAEHDPASSVRLYAKAALRRMRKASL